MIHYELRCEAAHGFDGWFKNSASFDEQSARGLLSCPVCGSAHVSRALMTPAVAKRQRNAPSRENAAQEKAAQEVRAQEVVAAPPMAALEPAIPDQVRAVLQKLRAEVERHCDYVGPEFAEEARRIHRGEADRRGIYGETTPEQAELLADEGIEVARIPWIPRADG